MSPPEKLQETQSSRSSSGTRIPCLFFKLMEPSIIQGRKMIPNKFVRKFGDVLSEVATLILSNGDEWLVKLRRADNKLWFETGWHVFVEHYSIRAGYLLIFKYEGDSNFGVSVFDLPAYEINYPLLALNKKKQCPVSHGKETQADESLKILDSCQQCSLFSSFRDNVSEQILYERSVGIKNSMSSLDGEILHPTKDKDNSNLTVHSRRDIGIQFDGSNLDGAELHTLEESKRMVREKQRTEPTILDVEVETSQTISSSITKERRHRAITLKDRERAINAAEKFKPDNPYCQVILTRSYVSKGLYFPTSFCSKHLPNTTGFITLENCIGKKWSVRCLHDNQERRKLSLGWSKFARDNHLKQGDVCVFELIKSDVLKVTMFRVFAGVN
ncbi:B3 domain-containing transcription factor VRN1 [Quillaja saponaria]|uniref:B3 domain-containing transcription factor VRN1 n=1 Tax=Quillaja saponaria TaxID=32244 RepID=A0AAD7P8T6_QUISA|nr:B3 domain-containing transcription factor VRN1 [Quillaja saponaria]